MPLLRAISSIDAAWKPCLPNTASAAFSIRSSRSARGSLLRVVAAMGSPTFADSSAGARVDITVGQLRVLRDLGGARRGPLPRLPAPSGRDERDEARRQA